MLRRILVAVLLLAVSGSARGEELEWTWTGADTAWEAAAVSLIAVDWMQTTRAMADVGWEETNPILGAHPSQRRVNTLIGGALVGHVVLARLLPAGLPRRAFQTITVVVEGGAVSYNVSSGIGLKVPF